MWSSVLPYNSKLCFSEGKLAVALCWKADVHATRVPSSFLFIRHMLSATLKRGGVGLVTVIM